MLAHKKVLVTITFVYKMDTNIAVEDGEQIATLVAPTIIIVAKKIVDIFNVGKLLKLKWSWMGLLYSFLFV